MQLPTHRKLKLSPSTFANTRNLQFLYVPSAYDQDGFNLLPQGLQSIPQMNFQLRNALYWTYHIFELKNSGMECRL